MPAPRHENIQEIGPFEEPQLANRIEPFEYEPDLTREVADAGKQVNYQLYKKQSGLTRTTNVYSSDVKKRTVAQSQQGSLPALNEVLSPSASKVLE